MSWVITGALVLSAVVSAKGQRDAAKAQQIEFEAQAEQEKIAADSRELQRRQRMNKALSQNVIAQAMSGMKGEGTPESLALASAKEASLSEGVMSLSDRLRQAQLKRQGKNVRAEGETRATSTLLSAAVQTGQIG